MSIHLQNEDADLLGNVAVMGEYSSGEDFKDVELSENEDADSDDTNMTGQQELYRGFSAFMSFAFCFTSVSVIPSISLALSSSISLGGAAELVWSWLFCSVFTIISGLSLAEVCSVYPSAGSVYYWASKLAPPNYAPIACYITGWFNLLGNVAGVCSFASGFATTITYAANMANSTVELSDGVQIAIALAALLVWSLLNEVRSDVQGMMNNVAIAIQVGGSLVVVVLLLWLSGSHATVDYVFTSVNDKTGLSADTKVMSWGTMILGLSSSLFAFTGYDAGAQLAEETKDAERAAPMGIIGTVMCAAVFGFIYILGMLFATPDIAAFDIPLQGVYEAATGKTVGIGLMILNSGMFFFGGMSNLCAASRIVFAMARDGALPMSRFLRRLHHKTKSPIYAVTAVCFFDGLFLLLPLVNTSALDAFTGSCTIGYQMSYVIPIFLRATNARKTWVPGKWNLGVWSLPFAWITVVWLLSTSFLLLWPQTYPVDSTNMNWTIAVVCAILLLAAVTWFLAARYRFTGIRGDSSSD